MTNKPENMNSSNHPLPPNQSEECIPTPESKENLIEKIQSFQTELADLKENVLKRKRENTALKILLYVGFALLLIGFIYSNTSLQKAQLETLERNIKTYQGQIQQHLFILQADLLQQSKNLVHKELAIEKNKKMKLKMGTPTTSRQNIIRSLLKEVDEIVFKIVKNRPNLQTRGDEIKKRADSLLKTLEGIKTPLSETNKIPLMKNP